VGCYIHPYQPLEHLIELVETLESWQAPFLDLADLDHSVELPEALLLTGHAQRKVTLRDAVVRRKVLDRAGRLISQEEEQEPSSGERTFTGPGTGDYEMVEWGKPKP
jgi:hypothetical protein